MATVIHCTDCGTALERHCEANPSCTWQRCPNRDCAWTTYDLVRGSRLDRSNRLERWHRELDES